jgi:DNA-binding NarL/FixJ family response regulator
MRKNRILIVDDQTLFAENLKTVLEFRAKDFNVVGMVTNGQDAVAFARAEQPEIILMDIRMPGMDGVQATRIIHGEFPEIRIIVLTTFDDDEYILEALKAGAMGYILKDVPFAKLAASLRAALSGAVQLSPSVMVKLVQHGAVLPEAPAGVPAPAPGGAVRLPLAGLAELGRREREILLLIGKGYDNASIGAQLFLSEQTVKNYVYAIYNKLGEHNRIKVMQYALQYSDRAQAGD